ncbi:hydrogen peroxide-inducible genes activator [Paracoccus tegillarcae]|uniref:LysR family transcriptional regulator n=1 Tax=Paracoccus tegillarcae TaxID=1529068 RepID=A0A2K9EY23_9RHOB|nr:hydrogen peroxide-inducible genes activator [Paracoccus tegillarcae]AUH32992.1 LysR family transcriptional regulator [Paracoccus tegillarcae]
MKRLTLRHLRYFEALARWGHFGRAAEMLAISQPALSVQMKELEDILGAQLIERGPKQISLTGLGEVFADRARAILQSVDDLTEVARIGDGPLQGRLRLGVIPTVAPYMLPSLIRLLGKSHPHLDLYPREAVTQKLIDDLTEGRLDTAIVALPVSEAALHEEPLFTEEFALVRPIADKDKPVPRPEILSQMRLLLLEEGHCFRDQALAFCGGTSAMPRDLMEGSSLSTLVQMVGAGIGVTLIPEMALPLETGAAPVCSARLSHPQPTRTIGMIWRNTSPLSGQLQQIAKLVQQALGHGPKP